MSSKPVDPRKRAAQMNAGSQIHSILNPLKPVAKSGPKPVNHAAVNRQNLKATQVRNQLQREEDHIKATEEPFKMQRFKHVDSVVKQRVAEAGSTAGDTHAFTRKGEGKGIVAKLGSLTINSASRRTASGSDYPASQAPRQQQQQYDDEDDEDIYGLQNQQPRRGGGSGDYGAGANDYDPRDAQYDDSGRGYEDESEDDGYPQQQQQQQQQAGGYGGQQPQHRHQQSQQYDDERVGGRGIPAASSRRPPPTGSADGRSFIQSNALNVIQASRQLASARDAQPASVASRQHENYGKVPAYITEAKNNLAAKKAAEVAEKADKQLGIPAGMVLMPEDQRLQTLEVLHENHKKVMYDISCFPLRVETISRKKALAELEAKLEEIDKAITLFSRKRVLIQP